MQKRKEYIQQEVLINYSSKHKNIVKLFGYCGYKHYYLLMMEYLSKKDLKHFIKKTYKKDGKFSEILASFFIFQILEGLVFLKENGIIHRDIKPENIMLDSQYNAKIGDFSLSRKVDREKGFLTTKSGTIPFLPPEALESKSLHIEYENIEKLDIFSLGVLFYYMLFYDHPFKYKVSLYRFISEWNDS